jgi:hypothetical protein
VPGTVQVVHGGGMVIEIEGSAGLDGCRLHESKSTAQRITSSAQRTAGNDDIGVGVAGGAGGIGRDDDRAGIGRGPESRSAARSELNEAAAESRERHRLTGRGGHRARRAAGEDQVAGVVAADGCAQRTAVQRDAARAERIDEAEGGMRGFQSADTDRGAAGVRVGAGERQRVGAGLDQRAAGATAKAPIDDDAGDSGGEIVAAELWRYATASLRS